MVCWVFRGGCLGVACLGLGVRRWVWCVGCLGLGVWVLRARGWVLGDGCGVLGVQGWVFVVGN